MTNLIDYLYKRRFFLLFLLLELISFSLIIKSYYFHNLKTINASQIVFGKLYTFENRFSKYMVIEQENQHLLQENKTLRQGLNRLQNILNAQYSEVKINDSLAFQDYTYIPANVIRNQINRYNNYFTINRGKEDSITNGMGVITARGVMGIVKEVSPHYAVVTSLLNSHMRINVSIKNSGIEGTLTWNGENYREVQMANIPSYINITIGDTVYTNDKSTIFPKNIVLGTVESVDKQESENQTVVHVALFEDFAEIEYVYIVRELHRKERDSIEYVYDK